MARDELSGATAAALRERVKELSCLYGIAQIAAQPDVSLKQILQRIVELLPPAWQYPEIASARITLDGKAYAASGFCETPQRQSEDIYVRGARRGTVNVVYVEESPRLDEGPFLKEERKLINAVARQVGLILEHKQAEDERSNLQSQLMHADRLATIGVLAAGVAHELNEPLSGILGFSQLLKKCPGMPGGAKQDIEKIESASLHAREVIRKLLTFARQTPAKRDRVNLNQVVADGLYFFDSRCAKAGVDLVRSLSPSLPEITADPAQLNQVLVNLVANALQEMQQGGVLKVETREIEAYVLLIVEDTGSGMSDETLKKIFTPFFTTKGIGEGTGLGLPIVHGIVKSHGGEIKVQSKPGHGTRFEIGLPVEEQKMEKGCE